MEDFPKKFLLATDASEDATLAARAGADLSLKTEAELHLAHVWRALPRQGPPGDYWEYAYPMSKEYATTVLERETERIGETGGKVAGRHLREGSPAEQILDLADELGADLILLGSRGLGSLGRLVVGSVSERVVHHATCPVLVASGGEGAWPPRRVVIGDDGSEEAKNAGRLVSRIGHLYGPEMVLVRADSEPDRPAKLPEYEESIYERLIADYFRLENQGLEERAEQLEKVVGLRPETRFAVEDPAAAILEAAGENAATLVSVGSRGLGVVRREMLGSVSTKVLRAGRGSVLIHPRRRRG